MRSRDAVRAGWGEARKGAAYLVVCAVAVLGIFFLDVLRRSLLEGPELAVTAAEARGLTPGADVWVAGVRAGRVLSIRFDDPHGAEEGRVVVRAVLWHGVAPALRRDAEARIGASALLAPAVLKIDPGSAAAPPLGRGDTLRAAATLTPERFAARAEEAGAALDTLARARARLATHLLDGPGTLAALRRDPGLPARLAGSLRRMAGLAGPGGSLRPLMEDRELRAAAGRAGHRLSFLTDAEPHPAPAEVALALERLRLRLHHVGENLAAGRGTAGRAIADDEIRLQMERLRASMDSARAELAARPLRWLRVRPF